MDRFADRRFADGARELGGPAAHMPSGANIAHRTLSAKIKYVRPPVIHWFADYRGRLLTYWVEGEVRGGGLRMGLMRHGWRKGFDSVDIGIIIRAAAASSQPEPLVVRLRCADGASRWCLLRMTRQAMPAGAWRWYGTVEDMHDRRDKQAELLETALAESREHHRWSVELSPQVPWTATPDGAIEEVGPRWRDLTGSSPEQAMGAGWINALHPDDMDRTLTLWRERLQSGDPVDVDYRLRLRDGSYRWMRARAAARRDGKGAIIRWYGTLEDIHNQKLAQQAVAESEEHFRLAVQSARLGIWDYDARSGQRSWSAEFRAMLGLTADAPATTELALSLVHPDDRHKLKAMMDGVAANVLPPHFEATLRVHRADNGALRWIRSTGWATRTEVGQLRRIIVTFLDVTEQRDAEERIRWAATHDPMTRLPNRTLWQGVLEELGDQGRPTGAGFGLMLFDIDDLKRINDSLGHDAGDALLCGFAERLAAAAPVDAVVGRLGGDEFGLIAASLVDSATVQACSQAILDKMRVPFAYQGQLLEAGVSVGGAVFGEHGDDAHELFKAADLALYASKASGRSRLTMFHSQLRADAQQRSSMIHMARQVIAERLVEPYYQPKVDMRSGQVLGYEALLRWQHPRLGVQAPATIAAAFEHGELAIRLTDLMLDAVLHDMAAWLRMGFDPGRVAVNASAADLLQADFADHVLARLDQHGVPAQNFEIEVTESVFLGRGADQVARALDRFARGGVRIALDDFGTGFASLSHLKQYPVNVLKIDRSFVSHVDSDAGDAAIVDAVIKLGSSFRMEVVAEGVETAEQAALLLQHGCHIAQGYHYGRPQPAASVLAARGAAPIAPKK